jgi:hypothetical protein
MQYSKYLQWIVVATVIFTFCFTPNARAVWQQGQATVTLVGADLESARVQAIKNAVANAAFQHGSFVSAEDIVLDGLLVSSKSVITTQGNIQRVEIISETLLDDTLSVIVRVEISPLFNCTNDQYARSVLITQFQLLRPKQVSHGGLFDLGKQITKRFERQLSLEPNAPKVSMIDKAFTNVRYREEINLREITDKSNYLAREYGQQFIVFGFIRDISLFEQVKEALLSDDVTLRRNFTIQVYVLDAYRHNILFQESYHSEATWEFNDEYNVDTNNSLFWRSDYGRVVLNTVNGAVLEVANLLQCEKSFAQIINNNQQKLTINMGVENGIKLGDKFTLYKKRFIPTPNSMNTPILQPIPSHLLNVIQVNSLTSVLESDDIYGINNADILDLVSPSL